MRIPTDAEMDKYPHVFITADSTWDPSILDNEFEEEFYDAVTKLPEVQARRATTMVSYVLDKITKYYSRHRMNLSRPTRILLRT